MSSKRPSWEWSHCIFWNFQWWSCLLAKRVWGSHRGSMVAARSVTVQILEVFHRETIEQGSTDEADFGLVG
jgi:hypothetical protein